MWRIREEDFFYRLRRGKYGPMAVGESHEARNEASTWANMD